MIRSCVAPRGSLPLPVLLLPVIADSPAPADGSRVQLSVTIAPISRSTWQLRTSAGCEPPVQPRLEPCFQYRLLVQ